MSWYVQFTWSIGQLYAFNQDWSYIFKQTTVVLFKIIGYKGFLQNILMIKLSFIHAFDEIEKKFIHAFDEIEKFNNFWGNIQSILFNSMFMNML